MEMIFPFKITNKKTRIQTIYFRKLKQDSKGNLMHNLKTSKEK